MSLPAEVARATKEWVLPLQAFAGRRLTGVDLRPGLPSIVRSARIATRRTGGGADAGERVVGLWVPADRPALLPAGSGWSIEPGTELVVRVAYRKRWDREREPASDLSAVGLYFASGVGGEAGAMTLRAATPDPRGADGESDRAVARASRRRGHRAGRDRLAVGRAPSPGDADAAGRVGTPLLAEAADRSPGRHAAGNHCHLASRCGHAGAGRGTHRRGHARRALTAREAGKKTLS